MKFSFDQNIDDLMDLTKVSLAKNKVFKGLAVFMILMVIINIVSRSISKGLDAGYLLSWVVPFLLIAIFYIFLFRFFLRRRLNKQKSKNLNIGPRTITLKEEEVRVETAVSDTSIKWAAISRLGESDRSYFLYLGPTEALIIPKRIVNNPEEHSRLKEFVQKRIV